MQQVGNLGSIAGNFGIINPLVFNQFGYGTYAQVGQHTYAREVQLTYVQVGQHTYAQVGQLTHKYN